jgi:hypothetical protein
MNEEALYAVITDEQTYLFDTEEHFFDFMSEQNSALVIHRIEKRD